MVPESDSDELDDSDGVVNDVMSSHGEFEGVKSSPTSSSEDSFSGIFQRKRRRLTWSSTDDSSGDELISDVGLAFGGCFAKCPHKNN